MSPADHMLDADRVSLRHQFRRMSKPRNFGRRRDVLKGFANDHPIIAGCRIESFLEKLGAAH